MLQTGEWTGAAIADTVRAVAAHPAYQRSLRASLFDRFWRWLGDAFGRLVDSASGMTHARTLAVAFVVVVALLVVARVVWAARLSAAEPAAEGPARARRGATVEDAERLAVGGDFERAVHALYHAVLDRLAGRGLLRLHHSKTSGDYARELRARGAGAHDAFRRFGGRYDRVLFGHATVDGAAWAALRADAAAVLGAEPRP